MKKYIFEVSKSTPKRKEFIEFLLSKGHEVDFPNRPGKLTYVDGEDILTDMTAQKIWLEMWDLFLGSSGVKSTK